MLKRSSNFTNEGTSSKKVKENIQVNKTTSKRKKPLNRKQSNVKPLPIISNTWQEHNYSKASRIRIKPSSSTHSSSINLQSFQNEEQHSCQSRCAITTVPRRNHNDNIETMNTETYNLCSSESPLAEFETAVIHDIIPSSHVDISSIRLFPNNHSDHQGEFSLGHSRRLSSSSRTFDHTYCRKSALITFNTSTTSRNDPPVIERVIPPHINNLEEVNETLEHYLGPMNVLCIHCDAKHFTGEKVKGLSFNDCCNHGKVKLEPLPDPPPIFKRLFNGIHEHSNHFYERIRYYNNSFSFASFNANLVQFNNSRRGPFCFKIQGQIYYQINTSLYPADNELPSYGQLFIVDSNEATDYRLNAHSNLNADVLQDIDNAMRQYNIHAMSYRMMKEEIEAISRQNDGKEPELQLLFTLKKGVDKRRYNFQRVNEIAAVFCTTADGDIPESYVTIRNKSTKSLQYVSSMDENVEPWTYPLFYPHGTQGWRDGLKMVNSTRRVTRNAYLKYRMAIRETPNYFLMGRRLFQQWVVDNYVKMEKDKIHFLRTNQKKLRADSYEGLLSHLENTANRTDGRVGKVVILPSTYAGSPRNMLQIYQDAMTIVRKFDKPDLFITMTSNPKWKEIIENLSEGQTPSDRPDLVARVFDLKKDKLIEMITKHKIFGEVQAYVWVIEYQKRGLPHVHLLLTLMPNSKITTPQIVDKYISAEIPSPDENMKLHEIIKTNMVHGPCGAWCLDNNELCSKKYPKVFNDETTMDKDGYPNYKRQNTGTHTRRDGFIFDNRHVVPHNKKLLLTFDCHINVEVVSSIKAVKYLYKYIYKGHDAAAVVVTDSESNQNIIEHDEIKSYIETRYVSPPEACGRILNKSLHGRSHSVIRLPVHLPNQQNIMIEDINNEDQLRSALNKQTMLTDYFELNQRDPDARNFLYSEIPTHYVFKKVGEESTSTWNQRKSQFNVLGRMYSVSPTQVELFHLRLLLVCVRGATSYQDLKTVDGIVHETFVSSCLARGLIEDDNEWVNAMHEAEVWMMPRQLRQLFVRLLLHCHPIHPEQLWEDFKDALSQDFSRTMDLHQAHRKAYVQINTLLNQERSSLAAFPTMPQISEMDDIENEISLEQHQITGTRQYQTLNEKQKNIVDKITEIMENGDTDESRWIRENIHLYDFISFNTK